MSDIYKTIIISVVSGIITSAVIFICIRFFQSILIPWFRQITYTGIDVSGPWYWQTKGSRAKLELKQFANKISGVYTYVPSDNYEDGAVDIKIYTVTGEIRDRFVQLTMNSADPKRLGVLSYVLEAVGDGNELKGCCTFYATSHNEICSEHESLYRTEALAKHFDEKVSNDLEEDSKSIQQTAEAAAD